MRRSVGEITEEIRKLTVELEDAVGPLALCARCNARIFPGAQVTCGIGGRLYCCPEPPAAPPPPPPIPTEIVSDIKAAWEYKEAPPSVRSGVTQLPQRKDIDR